MCTDLVISSGFLLLHVRECSFCRHFTIKCCNIARSVITVGVGTESADLLLTEFVCQCDFDPIVMMFLEKRSQ